jgi:hypothetical protein
MKPTRPLVLLLPLTVAGLASYILVRLVYVTLPPLPVAAPALLAVFAAAELLAARSVRDRLAGRRGARPVSPLVVARLAALGKASTLGGALVTGAYLGALGYLAGLWGRAQPTHDALVAAAGAAAAAALALAGLVMERACSGGPRRR